MKKNELIEAPRLHDQQVKNCTMLSDRFHILKHMPKNAVVAEVGVLGGDWSRHILEETSPEKLVLIDTFYSDDYAHLKRFNKGSHEQYIRAKFELAKEKVEVRKGLSWDELASFPNDHFDWMYIDAAHDYESVVRDLEQAHLKLKPNGYLVMNDYIMYDYYTAEPYGVVQATNEFMLENDFEMLYWALHPGLFCDVVIRKRQ